MRKPFLVVCLLIAGCAAGPDYQRPDMPAVDAYRATPPFAGDQRFKAGAAIPDRWWESFGSSELNALIDRALAANPGIEAARAALRAAQESAAGQQGAYYPQVSASLQPTRQRLPGALESPITKPNNPYSLHTAQLSIAYTADVFGGNRRLTESLQAQAEFQRFELEAARLSLAANIATAAIQEASLRSQITVAERMATLAAGTLEISRRQLASGAIAKTGVAAQETALAQLEASLPSLRKQLAQNHDLLIALAGDLPQRDDVPAFELAQLQLPRELPLTLPARLVEQRPDVRAAEEQARSAAAQVGVAAANQMPQFSLTSNIGSVATLIGELFKSGGGFWTLAGAVSQPLFSGGTLTHRKAAAEAAYEQAAAQYRATVISAFQNMADTLHALEQDAIAAEAAARAERAAAFGFDLARKQLAAGDISRLGLLNAEQAYLQTQTALVQAQANRYADTVALFQALGGGWWNQ